MKKWVFVLVVLSGCATTETVYLARDGKTVQCGPYDATGGRTAQLGAESLRACVQDFQKAGYQRVANP